MLAMTASLPSLYDDDSNVPPCLPSCAHYRQQWNEGFGCSSHFRWWLFPTPAECPCRGGRQAKDEDGMSDDDVIIVKQEEYANNVQQRQQHRQQQRQNVPEADIKIAQEAAEAKEEKGEAADDDEEDESDNEETDQEWTAILPVPLHYLCLRSLTSAAFTSFLRAAMGQTERDSGVHVIMHQQPCDARKPLMWGHCILYGSKEEVEAGKRALCAVMDSGYQHTADGRLLVAVYQHLKATQAAARQQAVAADAAQAMGEAMYEESDDDEDDEWVDPPLRRAADDGEEYDDDGDDEEWTTEDEAEYGVPNPPDVFD